MEEQLARQKQILREATAKHQNLVRHLKLVEAESSRITYDDSKMTQTHTKEELCRSVTEYVDLHVNVSLHYLCRDVCLLEQELAEKEVTDEKLKHDLEIEKEKV